MSSAVAFELALALQGRAHYVLGRLDAEPVVGDCADELVDFYGLDRQTVEAVLWARELPWARSGYRPGPLREVAGALAVDYEVLRSSVVVSERPRLLAELRAVADRLSRLGADVCEKCAELARDIRRLEDDASPAACLSSAARVLAHGPDCADEAADEEVIARLADFSRAVVQPTAAPVARTHRRRARCR